VSSLIGIAAAVSVLVWAGVMGLVASAWTDDRRRTHQEEYDDWRLARYGDGAAPAPPVDVPFNVPVDLPADEPEAAPPGRWDQLVTTIRLEEAGSE
jgi:hypothetical protein